MTPWYEGPEKANLYRHKIDKWGEKRDWLHMDMWNLLKVIEICCKIELWQQLHNSKFIKDHWIVQLKWLNFTVHKLYLN